MKFTKEELAFLAQVLDSVNVSGLEAKAMVVQILTKIAKELEKDAPPK